MEFTITVEFLLLIVNPLSSFIKCFCVNFVILFIIMSKSNVFFCFFGKILGGLAIKLGDNAELNLFGNDDEVPELVVLDPNN